MDAEAADIFIDCRWAAQDSDHDVGGDAIALGDGQTHQFFDRNIGVAVGMRIAEGAVLVGGDEVTGQKAHLLVEAEFSLLHGVKSRHGDGQLVDGLHRERVRRVEIAGDGLARERARYADAPVSLGRDAGNFAGELCVCGEDEGEQRERGEARENEHPPIVSRPSRRR